MGMNRTLIVYFDYKSPYTFIARDLIYDLEKELRIDVDWRPYCINIPDMFGSAEVTDRGELVADGRSDHQWRRIRYLYLDCRRVAQKRGLTLRAPLKVFRSDTALIGMLYARRRGALRPYHDLVFDRFWRRDLNIDDASAIADALQQAGVDASAFTGFERGEGRTELARIMDEAHEIGVFGVPSFVVGGELYWGREHLPDIRRILLEPA
jgi:2-hydroxychromene-2-carboxylate isomerase